MKLAPMPDLERCPTCDELYDPASYDDVKFHVFAECIGPNAEKSTTGIRGVLVDETPQG